ncbi:Germinal-center associated nuclear protein [Dermatophagoides pteronyssinus]|uniref:Germinal-center associated nuclear protein n=1 Tax=Dermatophagoides pteronyssinus TaxID=6956 RepID=A0ABQ8JX06_DERPT|nr:Germinal-center associated nuclear protein [Dermatophagoides pteronyssinus]
MEIDSEEERRLQSKLNECAITFMDKKNVLDARDKLLRLRQDRQTDLAKAVAVVGTCPDMCPELERYFRIETNQVSPFEMDLIADTNGKPDESRMVKEYRRSGADQEEPLAHELRPIHVLEYTMNYLCLEIVDRYEIDGNMAEWFDFIWSRTRSIRKDITQQHLIDIRSVTLIEQCARFHIFCAYYLCEQEMKAFDPKINEENLNNCLQTLKDFYYDLSIRGIYCDNEPEFRAYDILLNLGNGETLSELKHFQQSVKQSADVQLAIKLYQSYDNRNHVKFFRFVRRADFFKSCILNRYLNPFRIKALNIQRRAYSVPKSSIPIAYPVANLIEILAFDNFDELSYFCDRVGLQYDEDNVYFRKNHIIGIDSGNLMTRSHNLVMAKLHTTPGRAILGNNNVSFESYQIKPVHSSFNTNDKLIYDKNNLISSAIITNNQQPIREVNELQSIIQNNNQQTSTGFTFKNQIEKLATKENIFKTNDTVSFRFPQIQTFDSNIPFQVASIPTPQEKPVDIIDRKKIINQIIYPVFDSILKDIIRSQTNQIYNRMKMTIRESERIYNQLIAGQIHNTAVKTITRQKQLKNVMIQVSKNTLNSLIISIIRSTCKKVYTDHVIKIDLLRRNISSFANNLFDEMLTVIARSEIESAINDELRRQDERIKQWRHHFIQRKYLNKWFHYYRQRKRYNFYRETFPAAPIKIIQTVHNDKFDDEQYEDLFLNNISMIDDNYIKMNDSFKRKLAYSTSPNDLQQNETNKRFLSSMNGMIKNNDNSGLMRKYFQRWLREIRRVKRKRIRQQFPSAPMTYLPNEQQHLDQKQLPNSLSIIDTSIVNAGESLHQNLLRKLNCDFDSTVTLIRKTLSERRQQRQQLVSKSMIVDSQE